MKNTFDDRDFRASHDPIEDRSPSLRQILAALAVLVLVGIHWMPVAAWLDGADGRTVGEAVLEMWGFFVLAMAVAGLIILVVMAAGFLFGRVLTGITDGASWPTEEDARMVVFEAEEKE